MNQIINLYILDTGSDYYTIKCDSFYFGRMYDNNATFLKVSFPEYEKTKNNICKCIFYRCTDSNSPILDRWPSEGDSFIDNDLIPIKNTITQNEFCYIKFEFTNSDGTYFKNSELKKLRFAYSIKPDGFEPDPQELTKLDVLWKTAHVGEIVEEFDETTKTNNYIFRNAKKETIAKIPIYSSPIPQEFCVVLMKDLVELEAVEIELTIPTGMKLDTRNLIKILANGVTNGIAGYNITILEDNRIAYIPNFTGGNITLHIIYYII